MIYVAFLFSTKLTWFWKPVIFLNMYWIKGLNSAHDLPLMKFLTCSEYGFLAKTSTKSLRSVNKFSVPWISFYTMVAYVFFLSYCLVWITKCDFFYLCITVPTSASLCQTSEFKGWQTQSRASWRPLRETERTQECIFNTHQSASRNPHWNYVRACVSHTNANR